MKSVMGLHRRVDGLVEPTVDAKRSGQLHRTDNRAPVLPATTAGTGGGGSCSADAGDAGAAGRLRRGQAQNTRRRQIMARRKETPCELSPNNRMKTRVNR